jgi:hypothetical protein
MYLVLLIPILLGSMYTVVAIVKITPPIKASFVPNAERVVGSVNMIQSYKLAPKLETHLLICVTNGGL